MTEFTNSLQDFILFMVILDILNGALTAFLFKKTLEPKLCKNYSLLANGSALSFLLLCLFTVVLTVITKLG